MLLTLKSTGKTVKEKEELFRYFNAMQTRKVPANKQKIQP